MEYTNKLEKCLIHMQDDDIDDIFDFLNDKDVFRSFGQALEAFVVKRMPGSFGKTPREYVQKCLNDKKIHMNVNTLKNWFSGTRPKKGKQTRENLYLIAFALELNADDTAELFQKVYYDKAFDIRDRAEFIYFYCLSNRLDYQTACRMLSIVEESDTTITPEESTIFTGNIVLDAEQLQEEMQVISYIKKHPYNFRIHNKQAKKELNRLIDRIRISNDDKEALQKYRQKVSAEENKNSYNRRVIPFPKCESVIMMECPNNDMLYDMLVYPGRNICSIPTMLDAIIQVSSLNLEEYEEAKKKAATNKERVLKEQYQMSMSQNKELAEEIRRNFPDRKTFSKLSKQEPSFEELRKMIILLFSYRFWVYQSYKKGFLEHPEDALEKFRADLNDLLYNCSLPTLYSGNPFDWLFLYCTNTEDPLLTFRMLFEIIYEQDLEDF